MSELELTSLLLQYLFVSLNFVEYMYVMLCYAQCCSLLIVFAISGQSLYVTEYNYKWGCLNCFHI